MNKHILLSLAVLSGVASSSLCAHAVRVPANQPTIQLGITAAADGDTVLVEPGVYKENINFRGKLIVVTSRYEDLADSAIIATTIIDGSTPIHPDTGSVVVIANHEDSTAVLQGFTIRGGTGTKWTDEHGSGVYREGGGILVASSSPTIRDNVIVNNAVALGGVTSAGGGGIRAGDGKPHILHNIISGNTGRYGAGVVLNFSDVVFRNNIVTGNAGGQDYGGGAVWINHPGASTKIFENNTITANSAAGGGIYVWFGSATIVRNTIVWGNTGPQMAVRTGAALTVTYCDVQGGYAGTGNINSDPSFKDLFFHLNDSSHCVDGGDTAIAVHDPLNPADTVTALWPSLGTTRSDIGVYGGPGRLNFPPLSGATSVGYVQGGARPGGFYLEQNYPNPFNPSTNIGYTIASSKEQVAGSMKQVGMERVRLAVYDLLGQEVAVLVDGYQTPGEHRVVFDARNLASGVYLYRLTSGGQSLSSKLVLLR